MADQKVVEDRSLRLRREPGALEAFERKTAWPMLGVVVASLLLLLVPVFVPLTPTWASAVAVVEWTLWLVFAAEFVTRWSIAVDRASFVKHNVIDLLVVALPMFPALRAFRTIRLGRIAVIGARVIDQSDAVVKRSNAKYGVMVAGLLVLLAAAMVWHVEHLNPDASIHSFADALWWAVATVTTVGYGDKFPVSPEGKTIAISLMILGIGIFGLVSATLASMFVSSETQDGHEDLRAQMSRLESELDDLLRESDGPGDRADVPVTS